MTDKKSNEDIILNYTENFTVPTIGCKANYQLVNEILNKLTEEIYTSHGKSAFVCGYSITTSHDATSYLNIIVNINFYGDDENRHPSTFINNIKQIFVKYMTIGE